MAARRLTVLFRAAAGPRLGFGHLVRAQRLAAALDADAWLSVRGLREFPAISSKVRLARQSVRSLEIVRPDLLVLDTPVSADARRWLAAARRLAIPVASVHDAGIAPVASDLAVDGSLAAPGPIPSAMRSRCGVRFIVIDPRAMRRIVTSRGRGRRVLIALGGGTRSTVAIRLARAIAARQPDTRIEIAGGFLSAGGGAVPRTSERGTVRLGPLTSLVPALCRADVVVVAGGLTLYEAAAIGVPAVPIAIVPAQRPTIAAFAKHSAVLDPGVTLGAGRRFDANAVKRAAAAVVTLLDDAPRRRRLSERASRLVDSHGAERVADALRSVVAADHRAVVAAGLQARERRAA